MTALPLLALAGCGSDELPQARARLHDDTLLHGLRAGDERALETIFTRLADPLAIFARRVGIEAADAEQVVIDVFHDIWHRRQTLAADLRLESYLFRAVRNRALDLMRANARRVRYETESLTVAAESDEHHAAEQSDAGTDTPDVVEQIRAVIATLVESQRTALYLRYTREMPVAEVASTMGISIGATKMLLQRAIRTLRERVGGVFTHL